MARSNNYDIHSSAVGLYGWGLSLDLTGKGYEVSKRTWDTYEHALAYVNDPNDSAVPGNILTVVNDPEHNGVYLVKSVKGYKLGKAKDSDQYNSIIKDEASVAELVKLGDASDTKSLQDALDALETIVTSNTNRITSAEESIAAIDESIGDIKTTLETKVDDTRTIAGIDLADDITADELKEQLGVSDLDYVKDIKVGGKLLVKDENKAVNITLADLGLTNALHFIGVVAELPETGNDGDVVLFGTKEYVYSKGAWVELGDEGSHALKTIQIIPGAGLTGGGNLSSDVNIALETKEVDVTKGDVITLNDDDSVEIVTNITTDEHGRVSAVKISPVKIQETVVSSTSADYISVSSSVAEGKKQFDIAAAIGKMADATEGLASVTDVKTYVDKQIEAVSGEIPATTVTGSDFVAITESQSGVATDYKVEVKTKAIAASVQGEEDGLAKALDVKTYVDNAVAGVTLNWQEI